MNSLAVKLILLLLVLFSTKLSQTKELETSSEAAESAPSRTDSESSDYSAAGHDQAALSPTASESQQTQKPVNCDRVDSEFFRYLLKRYNKDNQQTGRTKRLCSNLEYAATHCHRPNENLVSSLIQKSDYLNEDDFNFSQGIVRLCPLLLFKIQDQTCPPKLANPQMPHDHPRPNPKYVWSFTLLFVTIISFCSLIGVVVMPFADSNSDSYKDAFNLFEGLAVGSLVASSLFHLLPQAFNLTNKNDDYLLKAMLIFGGIYIFFWIDLLMKLVAELRKRRKKKSISQANLQLLEDEMRINKLLSQSSQVVEANGKSSLAGLSGSTDGDRCSELAVVRDETGSKEDEGEKVEKVVKNVKIEKGDRSDDAEPQQIATVAWMIIFGDGLHNFIDGLSIGAAFSESIMSGISVSIAVICEELPHELGDFAVLIASGMTMRQAIGYNFLSACTCYLGAIFGIIIGDLASVSDHILALGGGLFLYVGLVNVMGELTTAIDEALLKSKTKMFKVIFYQHTGILSGIFFLFFLAKYSETIRIEHLFSMDH